MDSKSISMVSGTALLALTVTASAGPMSVASSQMITPPTQIEQVYYHNRHYGWHHGYYRHYGWHRWHRPYYGYGYGYPYNNGYGYGYGTGLAALATAPLMTGRSVAASGDYCATPEKTCLLYEPGVLATGCSCKVPGGRARGTVTVE